MEEQSDMLLVMIAVGVPMTVNLLVLTRVQVNEN